MAAAPAFDLQSHSTCSDGALPPRAVVAAAADAGVTLLALTDHDTVDGVDEALQASAALDLRLVPAVELSALDGEAEDMHILGYLVDHRAPALLDPLATFRADRAARAVRMAEALRACGLQLELPQRRSIGRPHLAQAAFDHPANRMRLAREQIVNPSQLLEAYLVPGAPAYRTRTKPAVAEAIAIVHEAGGVAVWAHPFWDVHDPAQVLETIDRFARLGIDGVEAFYRTHDAKQTRLVARRCDELGLLATGSADFHGPAHPLLNRFRAFELYGLQPRLGPIAQ
ncbi:MAG TPA: PHP domain-containing protein [Solirubrobacteraceae bacterium]